MALFAHQGGWDEALFVAVPMMGIVALLWLARRRVDRARLEGLAATPGNGPESGDDVTAEADETSGD